MHICLLCHEYPPSRHGGVGTFTQTLGRSLVERGHRVSSVGMYPRGHEGNQTDRGVNVIRVTSSSIPNTGFVVNARRLRQALRNLHRESPIDVLEGPELSLAFVPKDFPAAKVIRMNGGHHFFASTLGRKPEWWRGWLEKQSFAKVDFPCAVSRHVAETTRELMSLQDRPIEILPNPVDVKRFRPRQDIAEQDGAILFAGAIREKKGIRQLVLAMQHVVAEVPHAKLFVAGRDTVDPETNRSFTEVLRDLIPATLHTHVEFLGAVEHAKLSEYIARSQICIYPSHMEALPLAWLEGLASGKAVVGSRTGPGPEVIEDGVSGLLCDPHQPDSISDCLITLLQNEELRRQLGAAARKRAEELFSVDVLVKRNEAFYEQCINHAGRR